MDGTSTVDVAAELDKRKGVRHPACKLSVPLPVYKGSILELVEEDRETGQLGFIWKTEVVGDPTQSWNNSIKGQQKTE